VSVVKYGLPVPAPKDHHPPFFQMPDGPATDERLGDLFHFDARLQARVESGLLERVLQRHRVDHGGQHAHVVGMGPLHATRGVLHAPKDVAAADDDAHGHAQFDHLADLPGVGFQHVPVDAVGLAAHEGLAAQFEQDAAVAGARSVVRRVRFASHDSEGLASEK